MMNLMGNDIILFKNPAPEYLEIAQGKFPTDIADWRLVIYRAPFRASERNELTRIKSPFFQK